RLTFFNRGRHELDLFVEIVALAPNPPELDQIGFAVQLPADKIARLSRRVGLHNVGIIRGSRGRQVCGDQRASHSDAWSLFGMSAAVAHLEVPHRPATVDNTRDTGDDISLKRV